MSTPLDRNSSSSYLRGQVVGQTSKRTAWIFKNMDYMKAYAKISKAKLLLGRVNLEFARLDFNDAMYMKRLEEISDRGCRHG